MASALRNKIRDLRTQVAEARERIENIRRGREDQVNKMCQLQEQMWRVEYKITKTEGDLMGRCGANRRANLEARLATYQQECQDFEDHISYMGNECRTFFDTASDEAKDKLAQLEVELRAAVDEFDFYRYCKITHNEELLDD